MLATIVYGAALDFLLEHDLVGKPEAHPRIKSEGMLFRIMLYSARVTSSNNSSTE